MPPFTFPTELPLQPSVRSILERLESDGSTPQQLAERARLTLELGAGGSNPEVAARLGLHPTSVRNWRKRWMEQQDSLVAFEQDPRELKARVITLLRDEPRSGGPKTFTNEQVAAIMALACEPPEKAGVPITHWSAPALAEEAVRRGIVENISHDSVSRFLKSGRPQAAQGPPLAHPEKARRPRGVR
jgi:putative transposase